MHLGRKERHRETERDGKEERKIKEIDSETEESQSYTCFGTRS